MTTRHILTKLESLDSNMGSSDFAAVLIEDNGTLQSRVDQAHALLVANPGFESINLNVMCTVLAGESFLEHDDVEADGDELEAMQELISELDDARYATGDEAERLAAISVSIAECCYLRITRDDDPEFRCHTEGANEHFGAGQLTMLTPAATRQAREALLQAA